MKYINVLKIRQNKQMRQVILNACVYAKQKINFTWPNMLGKMSVLMCTFGIHIQN